MKLRLTDLRLRIAATAAGLVAVRPDRQRRLYSVDREGMGAVRAFLAEFWPSHLTELKRVVEARDG